MLLINWNLTDKIISKWMLITAHFNLFIFWSVRYQGTILRNFVKCDKILKRILLGLIMVLRLTWYFTVKIKHLNSI